MKSRKECQGYAVAGSTREWEWWWKMASRLKNWESGEFEGGEAAGVVVRIPEVRPWLFLALGLFRRGSLQIQSLNS